MVRAVERWPAKRSAKRSISLGVWGWCGASCKWLMAWASHFTVIYGFDGDLINRVAIHLDPDDVDGTRDRHPWQRAAAPPPAHISGLALLTAPTSLCVRMRTRRPNEMVESRRFHKKFAAGVNVYKPSLTRP